MRKKLRKSKKNWSKFEEKMRKVELLPTWDSEAGYGPGSRGKVVEMASEEADFTWRLKCENIQIDAQNHEQIYTIEKRTIYLLDLLVIELWWTIFGCSFKLKWKLLYAWKTILSAVIYWHFCFFLDLWDLLQITYKSPGVTSRVQLQWKSSQPCTLEGWLPGKVPCHSSGIWKTWKWKWENDIPSNICTWVFIL